MKPALQTQVPLLPHVPLLAHKLSHRGPGKLNAYMKRNERWNMSEVERRPADYDYLQASSRNSNYATV